MGVVSAPPRQGFFLTLLKFVFVGAVFALVTFFLIQRYGDTPLDKAEKFYAARELVALQKLTEKRLKDGEVNPVFYSYYAVAEFSINPQSKLDSLLGHVRAVDARPIFRREAISRIWQVGPNRARAAQIFTALLNIENPLGAEVKTLTAHILEHEFELEAGERVQGAVSEILSRRYVRARNLQFRRTPSKSGEVIRRFADVEQVWLRKTAGEWVYVVDEDLHSGWVFSAYLADR